MARREHMVGHTEFYDAVRDARLTNGLEIEVDGETARLRIAGPANREGRTRAIRNRAVVRAVQAMLQDMRRAARQAEPVRPLWKHVTADPAPACSECGGRRFLEEPVTGEEWPCPVCNG